MDRRTFFQFIKFCIVGVINTAVDWLVFFILCFFPFFKLFESLAKALSFVVAATNSFILNSLWTFEKEFKEGMEEAESKVVKGSIYYGKFILVSIIGFFINIGVFTISRNYLFVGESDWMRLFSLALASFLVMIWNFFANKWWTYKE